MKNTRFFSLFLVLCIVIIGVSSCQPSYGGGHRKRGCGCPAWGVKEQPSKDVLKPKPMVEP